MNLHRIAVGSATPSPAPPRKGEGDNGDGAC
jgi:hypothetical protein